MLQIQLQLDNKTINLDPLDNVSVPSCLDLNDTLQHQESQVNVSIEYDSSIHKILVENNSIPVSVIEDGKKIFTGIIDSGLSWTDNGTPEPLNNIALVIYDNTYKLQNTAETPIAYINSSLTEIITKICKLCDLTYNDEGLLDSIQIPVFILNRDQEFYQAVNDLLFEYGFAFGFTGAGELKIINLKQTYDDQIIENLFTGVKFSRTKRKYTGIELNYGKITTKYNEQVYFEGGDLGEDNKIVPIIITPGSYYPFESDPRIESTEGQVYQEFSSGYAETQTLYNGEKRYTRSKDTQLLYTEDHKLVKDYSDNLTVDRTEFEYTQASVRFFNKSTKDAELKQLAIKATAYYRSPVQLIRGNGKKFKYDSKYIYDKDSANALAALMQQYFLGGNFKITFKTTQKLIPGQKTKINTGLSGIIADVIILSATKDIYSEIYDVTALTEQKITLDEKKWQIQKSMTASQVLDRTEIDNITIQTITTEYYLSDSRTELTGGTWEKTPPTATADKYIWTKTIYTYTNGRTEESKPVSISGEPGPQGIQGPQGDTGATGAQGTKTFFSDYSNRTWTNEQWNTYAATNYATSWWNSTTAGMRVGDTLVITATLSEKGNSKGQIFAQITSIPTSKNSNGYYDISSKTVSSLIGEKGATGATGATGQRGSLEFSGTEINSFSDETEVSYTITTASTGITSSTMPILVGDTYINTTTQDVWICSAAGTPTTAKWKYQGRRCSDKDDSNLFRMFTPATDHGNKYSTITKSVVKGENPFGKIDDLLKITNTNGTAWSNYIPYNKIIKIDPKKTYRHVTYIKQEDANYTDFIGIAGYEPENSFCLSLSGETINGGAYFAYSNNFGTLGRWYMVVGYIVANGTTTAPADSGVYDMVTKQKVNTVTNFQWKPNVTYCTNSGCLIGYTGVDSTKTGSAYLYDVRLDEVNGTEPTLNELLNLDTTTKSKGTWKASIVYNIGDIVYLNGNSYICTANHTSETSFDSTKWNIIASKGDKGDKGNPGATGAQGPKGEDSLGFAVKLNVSDLTTTATGTIFVSGYENSVQANVNGYVRYLGNKITVTKTALKPSNQFIGWIAIPVTGGTPVLAYRTVAGQWKSISNGTSTDITGSNYVAIAEARFEASLKATASSVIEPIRLDVLGGNIRSIYWGKSSGNPAFSAVLVIGHFYLNTSNGNIYSYNGITWELNNATDLEMQCMTDLLEIAQSSSSIGTPTFINKLVAYTAFINKLLSKEVTIDASTFGFIKSSNFAVKQDEWIKEEASIPNKGFGIFAGENGVSSIGAVTLRGQLTYFFYSKIRQLYAQYFSCDEDITTKNIEVSGNIELAITKDAQTTLDLPSTYISELNEGLNFKPISKYIKSGSLRLGGGVGYGMADNLKWINASSTTFDDAALVLGAMGSKTIGVGIIASAHSDTSGYVKFANGLLIQWGKFKITSTAAKGDKFPIEFKSLPTFTLVPVRYADDGAPQGDMRTRKLTIKEFKCEITNSSEYTIYSYAHWIAIGY